MKYKIVVTDGENEYHPLTYNTETKEITIKKQGEPQVFTKEELENLLTAVNDIEEQHKENNLPTFEKHKQEMTYRLECAKKTVICQIDAVIQKIQNAQHIDDIINAVDNIDTDCMEKIFKKQ